MLICSARVLLFLTLLSFKIGLIIVHHTTHATTFSIYLYRIYITPSEQFFYW
jgi:hypothetical protein